MSEEVSVVVIHYPKPERIQEFRDLVVRVKNTFKDSPGTISQHAFEVKNAEVGGPEIVVTEGYKDHASLEKVVSSDEFKEISELVIELVRQPPQVISGTPLLGVEDSRT